MRAGRLGLKDVFFSDNPFNGEQLNIPRNTDIVLADSYKPGEVFFARLAEAYKLAVIADFGGVSSERYASYLINYSLNATGDMYKSFPSCKYLLGPRFALLRKDYWDVLPSDGGYVLFAPGAADAANAVSSVIKWWRPDWPKLIAVRGGFAPKEADMSGGEKIAAKTNATIVSDPENFANLLAGASLVICTASVTAYEALALKKRAALFTVADNQLGLGEYLRKLKAAHFIGSWDSADQSKIEDAIAFNPDPVILEGLVNRRGAILCAEEICNANSRSTGG
jgi:spore coat polysaccharide biosynthesis predicted glycosyltransferase SpsG